METLYIAIVGLIVFLTGNSEAITCIGDNGQAVDWWIALKAPNGYSYVYLDVNNVSFGLSSNKFNNGYSNALGATLSQLYGSNGNDSVGYILYNDESPDGTNHESYGHTKGTFLFDVNGGFWLTHSIPKFPEDVSDKYSYPEPESIFGQSILCISLKLNTFDGILQQFLINKPFVYDANAPTDLVNLLPHFQDVLSGQWEKNPANRTFEFKSAGGTNFVSFAKNAEWDNYIYEGSIEPYYNTGMLIETWMDGSDKDKLPTFCTPDYPYDSINIHQVTLPGASSFPESKDHSKWCVSNDDSVEVICISDINRQRSQSNRGGGAVCTRSSELYQQFRALVTDSDTC